MTAVWRTSTLRAMVSGQLDIRRDEYLLYAQRFRLAGVTVEFHLRPRVPNQFKIFDFSAGVARREVADRLRVLLGI
jgi:acetyl esterase/lipase